MTTQELHDAILANAQAKALADAGNDEGCAAEISAALPKVRQATRLNYLGIANLLGPDPVRRLIVSVDAAASGDVFLSKIKLQMELGEGVDIGHDATRAMLDQLAAANVPNGLSASDAAAIKALAEVAHAVTTSEVSRAWAAYRPDGRIS